MSSHKKRRELNRATAEHTHARIRAELVNALAACKAKDEAILQENYSLTLSFQPDDAALKAWLGEPVAEVDDSGVVIVCRYDYKPKDKFYSPKGLK